MEPRELNRDVKRLAKRAADPRQKQYETDYRAWQDETDAQRREAKRLYDADPTFKYMNKASVVYLLRLNLKLKFVSPHLFGIQVKLPGEQ